jgi:hypothetical protein
MAVVLAVSLLFSALDPAPDQVEPASPPIEEVEAPEPPPLPSPRAYLYAEYPALAPRLDCMISRESTWYAGAQGAGGRYVGLAQFDLPTWFETPQGRSGASRYDPYASIDAMAWGVLHLGYGRWPVTSRRC